MAATRKVLHAPATLHRVDGEWSQVELCDAHVPASAIDKADRPEPDEEAGHAGRMVFLKGHKYEVTRPLARALAHVKVLVRVSEHGQRVVTFVRDHIHDEELPPERRERIVSPASPTFTPAQEAAIARAVDAKIAELGLRREDVVA